MRNPTSILITGASSGIGEALARRYAKSGRSLALSGRNADRLDAVAKQCQSMGAEVTAKAIAVTDRGAMETWIDALDAAKPLDLVIANAGIGRAKVSLEELHDVTLETFETNVMGVFNTIHKPLIAMRERGRGQIALMASLAGFRGVPSSVPYSASKVAVKAYGEALRGAVARHGVEVNVICPGYVVSRMTDQNKGGMPFLMSSERAAQIIAEGLVVNRGIIAFPWQTTAVARLMTLLPAPMADYILKIRKKRSDTR